MRTLFFGLAVAGATLASATAPAAAIVTVTVGGQQYEITWTETTFIASEDVLRQQIWFTAGDGGALASDFAREFAEASPERPFNNFGTPFFLYRINGTLYDVKFGSGSNPAVVNDFLIGDAATSPLATATPVPVPLESDAWAVLISTTALGLGFKLKQLKNKKKIDLEE